ncbi:MAG TPA: tRNA lysidine(34) synthetase TilS [Candidatus Acidoferrum sp.]|jgi:tRNA(Ile)-lysidine synthase
MPLTLSRRVFASIHSAQTFRAGDRVGVAVSGGADSVSLLLLLAELRGNLGIDLSVVHFNHLLRGRSSDADEKFAAKLAYKLDLKFHAGRADVALQSKRAKINLEDAARRARYKYFAELIDSGEVTHIAVAHTLDDQAETVLAHILRGTGIAGLGGIHPVARQILRPLLQIRRAELRAYLRAKKQPWREDATNRDTTKTRARIRKTLLPMLEKQFQVSVAAHLGKLAELARDDEKFMDSVTRERAADLFERTESKIKIPIAAFSCEEKSPGKIAPRLKANYSSRKTVHPVRSEGAVRALGKRLIRLAVSEIKSSEGQLNAEHVEAVLQLAQTGSNGTSLRLPGDVEVRRERESLVFLGANPAGPKNKKPHDVTYDVPVKAFASEAIVPVDALGCAFRLTAIDCHAKRGQNSTTGSVLDRDSLQFPLVLRNWRPGDRMQPLGHGGAHKLKRLLNKKRISRWERDGWPVLTSGGVIAWTRGFPVAAQFAASERTRTGIVITEEKQ